MQESISAPQVGGIVRMTGFILKAALLLEGTGTLLLALRFCPQFGLGKGLWYALFHAVSYTHLDVYKRQVLIGAAAFWNRWNLGWNAVDPYQIYIPISA